jgi:YVTN family beta-propeller protein
VDPSTNTLYVCSIRDDSLTVIDANTLAATTAVPVGRTPRSIALIPALQTAYTANYLDGTVSVVDTATNRTLGAIEVGGFPRAIAADPVTHRVYVTNFQDDSVTIIDGDTNKVLTTKPTGALPGYIHINRESHQVYVTGYSASTLTIHDVDGATTAAIQVGPSPSGVWTSTALDRVCVTSETDRSLWILRLSDNAVLGQVSVEGVPQAVTIDPARGWAYAADYVARRVFCIDIEARTLVKVIDLSRF